MQALSWRAFICGPPGGRREAAGVASIRSDGPEWNGLCDVEVARLRVRAAIGREVGRVAWPVTALPTWTRGFEKTGG